MKNLLSFALLLAAVSIAQAQYSFSAVASNGDTLFYAIHGSSVSLVPKRSHYPTYDHYPSGALTIPSAVTHNSQTYAVTAIASYALADCGSLTSVTIPNSVTSIGDWAFRDCLLMTGIDLPDSLSTIGDAAFSGCLALGSLDIPAATASIGEGAFGMCTSLASITLPATLSSIGAYAFELCESLDSLILPGALTAVSPGLCYECTALSHVTIPSGVTAIGYDAFYNCASLADVTLPATLATIGNLAFAQCSSLSSVTIPSGVTSIGLYAFASDTSLASVAYNAASCATVGGNTLPAFAGCVGLASLTIGSGVQSIPGYAFAGCSSLAGITSDAYPAPLLGANAFSGVSSAIPVTIPCGSASVASYGSRWTCFTNLVETAFASFQCGSSDTAMGIALTLTQPTCSAPTARVCAVARPGYSFDRWSDSSMANPYTLTVTADTSLTALFVPIRTDCDTAFVHDTLFVYDTLVVRDTVVVRDPREIYTLTVESDDSQLGVAAGSGRFPDSTVVEIAAIPLRGSRFVAWQDGSADNPRRVMVTADAAYAAAFAADAEGVAEVEPCPYEVTAGEGRIVVRHAAGRRIRIYDSAGRLLNATARAAEVQTFRVSAAGAYLVQVSDHPAQKVVVPR